MYCRLVSHVGGFAETVVASVTAPIEGALPAPGETIAPDHQDPPPLTDPRPARDLILGHDEMAKSIEVNSTRLQPLDDRNTNLLFPIRPDDFTELYHRRTPSLGGWV